MGFVKATRKKIRVRIGVFGPAGSGKTWSALEIATGLADGGKIAVIDTEHGSASLYSDFFDFDVQEITPPYTPEKFISAIKEAEKAGYSVLVIDSLSHVWSGEGGELDIVDKATSAARGNTFIAWREVTPRHNKLVDTILQSGMDVICTFRTKTAYEVQDINGKKVPVKVGMAPVFRDGVEYEFTTCFDLTIDHIATASKDRTHLWDGQHFIPTKETGRIIRDWINSGSTLEPKQTQTEQQRQPQQQAQPDGIGPTPLEYRKMIAAECFRCKGMKPEDVLSAAAGYRSTKDIPDALLRETLEAVTAFVNDINNNNNRSEEDEQKAA